MSTDTFRTHEDLAEAFEKVESYISSVSDLPDNEATSKMIHDHLSSLIPIGGAQRLLPHTDRLSRLLEPFLRSIEDIAVGLHKKDEEMSRECNTDGASKTEGETASGGSRHIPVDPQLVRLSVLFEAFSLIYDINQARPTGKAGLAAACLFNRFTCIFNHENCKAFAILGKPFIHFFSILSLFGDFAHGIEATEELEKSVNSVFLEFQTELCNVSTEEEKEEEEDTNKACQLVNACIFKCNALLDPENEEKVAVNGKIRQYLDLWLRHLSVSSDRPGEQ